MEVTKLIQPSVTLFSNVSFSAVFVDLFLELNNKLYRHVYYCHKQQFLSAFLSFCLAFQQIMQLHQQWSFIHTCIISGTKRVWGILFSLNWNAYTFSKKAMLYSTDGLSTAKTCTTPSWRPTPRSSKTTRLETVSPQQPHTDIPYQSYGSKDLERAVHSLGRLSG